MDNKHDLKLEKTAGAVIELTSDLFVGRGLHRECYRYPGKPGYCIKVAYNEGGTVDLVQETEYREILSKKALDYSVLPAYYGTVETTEGTGYVYEYVVDYDGNKSMTVEDILQDPVLLEKFFDRLVGLLKQLHRDLVDNRIITMGLFSENIIVQRVAPNEMKLRIVNDMGTATFIPVAYYFDFFAKKHVEKRWLRFTQHLIQRHRKGVFPSPLVLDLARKIE